jgi:hypothetical protein
MKQLTSLEEIEWITSGVRQVIADTANSVAHCIPPIFPAYAKLFHPINEALSIKSDDLIWQDEERHASAGLDAPKTPIAQRIQEVIDRSTLVYGHAGPQSRPVRIRWARLAQHLGLPFVPTLSSWSFTRQFPNGSWPRHLIGPQEGNLIGTDRDVLVSILRQHTKVDHCFFHVWLLATLEWTEDLLFEGTLDDASLFPDEVPGVRLAPTHWFPKDRSWLVCTDYDLTFTLIGGSEKLIDGLLNCSNLECVPVIPETRVDRDADLVGTVQ